MGCGSSSSAAAPGKFADDPDMNDDARIRVDKKTGKVTSGDGGKDDDGREDDDDGGDDEDDDS